MVSMDVFNNDAFSMTSLTGAIQGSEYKPSFLGSLGIFTPTPVRTRRFVIEKRGHSLRLIKADQPGAPRQRQTRDRRNVRDFENIRLAKSDELRADEIEGIRAFGSESELMGVAGEVATRQANLVDDLELTMENHRLGALNGLLLDSDGSVIEDYFAKWGIAVPATIAFNWAARTNVEEFINQSIIRPIVRALGGRFAPGASITALCGDAFFDAMGQNAEFKDTYKNFEDARMLRDSNAYGDRNAYGIRWVEYRGTDDNSDVAIPSNECRIFVQGVRDVFQVIFSPAPTFEYVNTPGLPMYSRIVTDEKRDEFVELDVESYPLHICTTPESILRGSF